MVVRYNYYSREPDEVGVFVAYEDYAKLKADRDYWYEKCLDAGLLDEERAGTNF